MTTFTLPPRAAHRDLLPRLLRAGLLTGVIDGTFASVVHVAVLGSTITRLFQGVASVLLGAGAFDGGARTTAIGLLMHFGVAFGWSAVFLFVVLRSPRVRGLVASPRGVVTVAAFYGPFIWMVMSLVVVPAILRRPPTLDLRWWIQFVGHFPFVGLPIVAASVGRGLPPTTPAASPS